MQRIQSLHRPASSAIRFAQDSFLPLITQPRRWILRRGWHPATRRLPPARHMQPAAAAAGGQQRDPQAHDPDSPVLVLAGFHLEELAFVRQLLDQIGGEAVRVVPTTASLLYAPASEALRRPEPHWDQPVMVDWQPGGGWGQQRMVLMAGILGEGRQMVVELLQEAGMPGVVPAFATPENQGVMLGALLAAALKAHRQSNTAGTAKAEAEAEPDLPVEFVDELPPVQAVVPEEVWHPDAASNGSRQRQHQPKAASSSSSDVVQAEFSESPRRQHGQPRPTTAALVAQEAAEEVPLDIIDTIATGSPGPADEMDSEELLAAAKATLGLDDEKLQQMVDDAAAVAAAAMDVPFVLGSVVAADAPATSSSSRGAMPWNTLVAAQVQQPSRPPAQAQAPSRDFATSSGPRKSGRTAKAGSKAGSSRGRAAWPAGEAAKAPAKEQAAEGAEAAGSSNSADTSKTSRDDGEGTAVPNKRPIPPAEQFILSRAQLKEVAEKHSLDFEELLQGLTAKGINLGE